MTMSANETETLEITDLYNVLSKQAIDLLAENNLLGEYVERMKATNNPEAQTLLEEMINS